MLCQVRALLRLHISDQKPIVRMQVCVAASDMLEIIHKMQISTTCNATSDCST